jgi:hypothetical protein
MIASAFFRRLKEGFTFEDFVDEWEADQGFGVPTRVFNAQSLDDPRDVISIGFVAVTVDQLRQGLAASADPESVRHDRISTVIESTALRSQDRTRLHTGTQRNQSQFSRKPPQHPSMTGIGIHCWMILRAL